MQATPPRVFTLHQGAAPLLISMPHVGAAIPSELQPHYTERALQSEDTDWHLEALYAFAHSMGASTVAAHYSRYVIDLNRPSENTPMYAGANNTELCPTRFFSGEALYRAGKEPDSAEIARRTAQYWQPYHHALSSELERIRSQHGHAVLFDAHSIKSVLPWLFAGKLPDLNLGTVSGSSCADTLRQALAAVLQSHSGFSHVVDGRFKGGYITRHYGQPQQNIHAVQLEMCWSCYMQETAPYTVAPQRAAQLAPVLRDLVSTMLDYRPH